MPPFSIAAIGSVSVTHLYRYSKYRFFRPVISVDFNIIIGQVTAPCLSFCFALPQIDTDLNLILGKIAEGKVTAVTGTHALIEGDVKFRNLGIVITDEQHRFGVQQRAKLGSKAATPDVMIMSATPIPRTLSLILYGDLDVSILNDMPPGRIPVNTKYVPQSKRIAMYRYIEKTVQEKGRIGNVVLQYAVNLLVGVASPAR